VFAAIVTAFLLNDRRFGAAPVSTGAETQIPAIEGIYRQRHEVRSVDGPSETAEDVVEIARYDPTQVFVRIVTRFDVGGIRRSGQRIQRADEVAVAQVLRRILHRPPDDMAAVLVRF
jgi:hypothetical protein